MTSLNSNLNLISNQYLQTNGISPIEFASSQLIQSKCVLRKLSVRLASKQPSGQNGYKFTLRINGRDTSLSVDVVNGEIQGATFSLVQIPEMSLLSVKCSSIGSPSVCAGCVTYD